MKIRLWTLAVLFMLAACAPAWAVPATVQLRVEGESSTIFEGPVTTDGKTITKGGNTLACDGTLNGANPSPGPTATSALDDGAIAAGFDWDATFGGDFFVSSIAGETGGGQSYWGFAVNFVDAQVGGCQQQVHAGDEVLFAFMFGGPPNFAFRPPLKLTGPARAATGDPITVSVVNGKDSAAVGGATFAGASTAQTAADGTAQLAFAAPGLVRLKAEKPDMIRSNSLLVCVSDTGTGDCGVSPQTLGSPAAGTSLQARDTKAPSARISGLRDGARYRRGPRVLRGSASDDRGVSVVKLALRRHVKGKPCRWWSGRRERFVGTSCRKTFFFAIGDNASWSYLLPHRLGPGRYVLDVKAFDRARNRDERFVRGRNRVVFEVLGRSKGRAATASRSRRAAKVELMVVGRERVLSAARSLRASETIVKASGRRCRVGASTPLAALARALRRERVAYHVRDFGHCSPRRPGGSGQLFVDRVGSDRNSGQNGWFYKIADRAASAGGADPSGPFGNGRLRDGARVLWFYCLFDTRAASCQRSLSLRPASRSGHAGEPLRLSVRSYDNDARGRPEAGVTVTLGPASALTDSHGAADLTLPTPGRYLLEATKPGAVAAFPLVVQVR